MEGAFSGFTAADDSVSAPQLLIREADGHVRLPQGEAFLRADFARAGSDLLIDTPDGGAYVVLDYFMSATPPALHTHDGAVLSADVVTALAGPLAPGQVAQAASGVDAGAAQQGVGLGEPIGQVSEAEGSVTATHPDGTQDALALGDSVYQGDVLETGAKGTVSIVFVDDTIFSLNGDGRMVMDEMVYDPGTQTGAFNAVVVQGVFSFVSGQIAKTSPEGMTVATPAGTIGIRGSTVLGKAAAEGAENKITLVRDVDGNIGEIIVSNAAGTMVLNQEGASTTLFRFDAAPTPVEFLSPQDIQQNFGHSLTRLVKVVAKKAKDDAQRATDKAERSNEDAKKAGDEAKQAEDEATKAEADAKAAQAEAEAAKAAAAEAGTDEEALAKVAAAEAKAAEALQKAADAKDAAEAKATEATAKGAEAEADAQQAQQAQQFNTLADTAFNAQSQAFEQFQQTQPPADQEPDGPQNGANGADKAGKADTVTKTSSSDSGDMIMIGADGKAVVTTKAMQDGGVIMITEDGKALTDVGTSNLTLDAGTQDADALGGTYTPPPGVLPPDYVAPPPPTTTYVPPTVVDVPQGFSETIVAPPGGGAMVGSSLNTNFYFPWGSIHPGSNYTITDAGGVDQISFDNLNNVIAKASFGAVPTSGVITTYAFSTGTLSTDIAGAVQNTVTFSGIDQFLLADIGVAGLAVTDYQTTAGGSVLVLGKMQSNDSGYVIAGSDSANTITIDTIMDGAVIFAKGGNDTININVVADGLDILGGAGTDTLSYVNLGTGVFANLSVSNGYVIDIDSMDSNSRVFEHQIKSIENFTGTALSDDVNLLSGTYGTIDTGAGYDAVFIHEAATFTLVNTGAGDDYVEVLGSELANIDMTKVSGGAQNSADVFAISIGKASSGSYDMTPAAYDTAYNDALNNRGFEYTGLSAYDALGSVTLTAWATGALLKGSKFGDTLNGAAGGDVLFGGGGADTLTGNGGADVFRYEGTTDYWGNATGGDSITDFVVGTDSMEFWGSGFGNLTAGALAAGNFISGAGAVATTATEYFIYDTSTDILSYDADGNGAGAAVAIADLTGITGAAFSETDIQIV